MLGVRLGSTSMACLTRACRAKSPTRHMARRLSEVGNLKAIRFGRELYIDLLEEAQSIDFVDWIDRELNQEASNG